MTRRAPALFVTVLIIATSGLVFELLSGALASYVLGDSITQFSTTIGVYLFAMGIGSYLTRFVKRDVAARFLEVELGVALVGGLSAPFLFFAFAHVRTFAIPLYGTVTAIGILVGLEIPLLMRILKDDLAFEELVARVLTFDYVGALLGSTLFALVFVPKLGLSRTSLLFGALNAAVAILGTYVLHDLVERGQRIRVRVGGALILGLLGAGFVYEAQLTRWNEQGLYADPIVHAEQSPYQRVVVTRSARHMQLFLNGNLQFHSMDEYRYHEALVHPAFAAAGRRTRVLILGGGDGLALREVYRYADVEAVTLVDLDPAVTRLGRELPPLRRLNEGSLLDGRTTLVHEDALVWLRDAPAHSFDIAIVDFPDPSNFSVGKLYTRHFYRLLRRALAEDGVAVVQSTSPLYARRAFWCVDHTLRAAGFETAAYHATVPSFGEWGYVLASPASLDIPAAPRLADLRYVDATTLPALFRFGPDMARVETPENRLGDQALVRLYEREWRRWN